MTEHFINIAVPFQRLGNDSVLSDLQLSEDPSLAEFVERFANCFERDDIRMIWIYRPS